MTKHSKPRQTWSPEQEDIVRKHYADTTPQRLEDMLNGVFNSRQIGHKANKIGIRKSQAYRAMHGCAETGLKRRGSVPWNKGLRYIAGGRSPETRFKPGSIPKNRRPVGSVRLNVEGYWEIKIAEGRNKWILLQREIWKQHHGEYPPRGSVIVFRDGNKDNCRDISNLELMTRKQLMARNTVHNLPESLKQVVRLRATLIRKINDKQGKRRKHTALAAV